MISKIYKHTLSILLKMPLKLWGLSLLSGFLSLLIIIFGLLPIITIPVLAVIQAGMVAVYFDAYKGKEVYSDQLFSGFKNFKHIAGGMCWKNLWLILWFLIPIVGIVLVVIKSLSYAFTPYILNEEKSVNATEALRKSMNDTKGYKSQMFLAIFLPSIGFIIVSMILALLSAIPYVGIFFSFLLFIVSLVFGLFAPLFFGLVEAGFYDLSKNSATVYYTPQVPQYTAPQAPQYTPTQPTSPIASPMPHQEKPVQPSSVKSTITCSVCDSINAPGTSFCYKCGAKLK